MPNPTSAETQNESSTGRILVVDDEELNRDLLSRRLTRKGYQVSCADGAAQADQKLQEEGCDLILLDIMMPDVDGFEYLDQIRERFDAAQLPVIMATAKDDSEDIVRALKQGANDYVTKPLDFQVVLARVETQLRLKRTTEELTEAHRLMRDDLQRAARYQQSLLPSRDLVVPGCRYAWSYLPCDALAGDFLNVIPVDETHTAFYVLDVCGHGTPAALMSAAAGRALSITNGESSVIARWTRKGLMRGNRVEVIPPAEVAWRLNRQFEFDINEGKYFTIAYSIFDAEVGELTYTQAGHPPPVLLRIDGDCELLPCDGVPIGLLDDKEANKNSFQERKISVASGDRIYIYSDGVAEMTNEEGQQYGSERLSEVIRQTRAFTLQDSIDNILKSVRDFCGDRPFDDDLSILAIEIGDET